MAADCLNGVSLLERLQQPLSNEERREIYRRIQRRVAEDVPILFTVYGPRLAIVGLRLEGVTSSLNGPFGAASSWWIPGALRR
jgi:ABC-type transport system substrate-binding protein